MFFALIFSLSSTSALARVQCTFRGADARRMVESAETVFVGEIVAIESVGAVPPGHRGLPDQVLRVRVTRAISAGLEVGSEVRVRWRGFAESEAGPIRGGCRTPEAAHVGRNILVVSDTRDEDAFVVANRSVSTLNPSWPLIRRTMGQWRRRP